jgi:hypothetical protein
VGKIAPPSAGRRQRHLLWLEIVEGAMQAPPKGDVSRLGPFKPQCRSAKTGRCRFRIACIVRTSRHGRNRARARYRTGSGAAWIRQYCRNRTTNCAGQVQQTVPPLFAVSRQRQRFASRDAATLDIFKHEYDI